MANFATIRIFDNSVAAGVLVARYHDVIPIAHLSCFHLGVGWVPLAGAGKVMACVDYDIAAARELEIDSALGRLVKRVSLAGDPFDRIG